MRLVCPHCAAAYDVPPALLAGRRAIRCARCGREWVPPEVAPPAQAADEPEPAESPDTQGEVHAPKPALRASPEAHPASSAPSAERLKAGVLVAWVASLLVLALAAWAAVAWRADVMHAWPPSQRAYSALGLAGPAPAPPSSRR